MTTLRTTTLVLPLLAGALHAQAPALDHTAPLLGGTLTFSVTEASPGATLGLLFGPDAAELALPAGTLELSPVGLAVVASGAADAGGAWSLDAPLPVNAAWAELEAHFQVVELDPGAPGGAVLGGARHLRLLGSRVMAAVGGSPSGPVLVAFSAVADEEVFAVELPGDPTEDPVYDTQRAVGAVSVTTALGQRLVLFDNYFGEVLATVPTEGRILARHPSGDSFWVSSYSADTIERVSFDGATLETLDVPGLTPQVTTNEPATEAYFHPATLGQPTLVAVDLATGALSAPLPVGRPSDTALTGPEWSGGRVLASTWSEAFGSHVLTQADFSTSPPTVIETDTGVAGTAGILPVPDAGVVLAWTDQSQNPFIVQPWSMVSVPLGAAGPVVDLGAPLPPFGAGLLDTEDQAVSGTDVWFTDRCCQEPPDGDEPGALWKLDVLSGTWSASPSNLYSGPYEVVVVDDAFGSRVFVERDSIAPFGFGETAKLVAFDTATLASETFEYTLTDGVLANGIQAASVP